jgi:hypothetical protein
MLASPALVLHNHFQCLHKYLSHKPFIASIIPLSDRDKPLMDQSIKFLMDQLGFQMDQCIPPNG